jgi:lysozyme family protein
MNERTRTALVEAKNVLLKRRASTADPAEQAAIDAALGDLDDAIDVITQASLLQAAGLVANATDALERVVASVRTGPFDGFLADIQNSIAKLQGEVDTMQGSERLALADADADADAASTATQTTASTGQAGAGTAATSPMPPAAAAAPIGAALPAPINSKRFDDLRDEYAQMFDRCHLRPEFASNVEFYVSRLTRFKPVYKQLGDSLGIPWVFIGVVHGMECGFNFSTHLHNGDPLTARTVRVPKGRPTSGEPPFTWIASARDALELKGLAQAADWSLPMLLYRLEAYNGFGYRPRRVPTPYLWSFSNLYTTGKFVADGVFNADAVSRQCGAAVMLRVLQERSLI